MTNTLIKKLLLNVCSALGERFGWDGCNDLDASDPLLKGISKEELEEIKKEWIRLIPEAMTEREGDMSMNFDILDVLQKLLEEVKISNITTGGGNNPTCPKNPNRIKKS